MKTENKESKTKNNFRIDERETASYILMEITESGAYSNIALRKYLYKNDAASAIQKSLVTELVNGVLRNIIFIDYVINRFSSLKTTKMKPFILNLLRISVYQMKFMDVPTYAVCNEAVKLTKKKGFVNLSGFVNGVLRSVSRNNIEIPHENDLEYFSILYSYPTWLLNRLLNYLDNDTETLEKMLKINNSPPKVTIRVNTLKIDKLSLIKVLKAEGVTVAEGNILANALVISRTANIKCLDSFNRGLYYVMDESAMLSALASDPGNGQNIMDVCAAPGGKSFLAAMLMGNSGNIISRDIHLHKLDLIRQSQKQLNISNIRVQLADASRFDPNYENWADILFVDAPCTGFGLLRKKPDIKYFKTEDDIANLSALQKEILAASWMYVKPGGTLLYSTCTLTKEENEDNINWFLANFPFDMKSICIDEHEVASNKKIISDSGILNILPFEYGTDGFFIAKMKRRSH